jgi:hypothetical protein
MEICCEFALLALWATGAMAVIRKRVTATPMIDGFVVITPMC